MATVQEDKAIEATMVPPVTLSWSDLSYTVGAKPEGKWSWKKTISKFLLKDLHGCIKPGELTCIMGPSGWHSVHVCFFLPVHSFNSVENNIWSGAGKTTLLNVLTGKFSGGKQKGTVFVNGLSRKKLGSAWKRMSSYVTQDDILSPNLTPRSTTHYNTKPHLLIQVRRCEFCCWLRPFVWLIFQFTGESREEIWFSAKLRIEQENKLIKDKVEMLVKELGLSGCADSRIGNVEKRGISGGQRKRAAIGVEMITEPSVLFLDEPTSGLDYSTSYTLVETLKEMAKSGRTIISTIHQPR